MEAFEFAGLLKDGGVVRWSGPSTGVIAGGESDGSVRAVEPPDLPNGVVGQLEFGGDRGEFLTLLITANDLLTDRHRQRAWHWCHSW
jgi:hypothetical protein